MFLLELDRRQHAIADMLAGWIVEHLDVIEHILPSLIAGSICPSPDPFALEQIEEAFGHCVAVAVPASAHGVGQIVVPQEG